jgi:hypothetical protein
MKNLTQGQKVECQTGLILEVKRITAKFYVCTHNGEGDHRHGIKALNLDIEAGVHKLI